MAELSVSFAYTLKLKIINDVDKTLVKFLKRLGGTTLILFVHTLHTYTYALPW